MIGRNSRAITSTAPALASAIGTARTIAIRFGVNSPMIKEI